MLQVHVASGSGSSSLLQGTITKTDPNGSFFVMVNRPCCEQGKQQQPQRVYKGFDQSEVVELDEAKLTKQDQSLQPPKFDRRLKFFLIDISGFFLYFNLFGSFKSYFTVQVLEEGVIGAFNNMWLSLFFAKKRLPFYRR